MSSWGLEVTNGSGASNLNPDSFTVKLVESVWVGWTEIGPNDVVDIPTSPAVLAGMFAVITDYSGQLPYNADLQSTFPNGFNNGRPRCLPVVEIYNGMIRVKGQPVFNSIATGMIVVSVMQYL